MGELIKTIIGTIKEINKEVGKIKGNLMVEVIAVNNNVFTINIYKII